VLAGLAALPADVHPDDFVLVHDAARPHLRASDLERLLDLGRGDPVGAILAAPVRDTLKRAGNDGGIDGTESQRSAPPTHVCTGLPSICVQPGHDVSSSDNTTIAPPTDGCDSTALSEYAIRGTPAMSRYCLGTAPP
jgi:hypothetical protein